MNIAQLEEEIVYIPINPFSNDTAPIKLDLVLYEYDDDYENAIYSPYHKKILHYHPFPKYFHISDLKFYEVKNIKEHQNYFYCPIHNKLYNKYINNENIKEIFCKECQPDENNDIKFFDKTELNWKKFNINKNRVINIIIQLIQEFYPNKINEFNKNDFCKIETEKIIVDNVNNILYNKEYDELFNKYLKLLILDFNSFIVSALKIFKTNKYYNKNYLDNLDLFEDIDFPQIFNLDNDIKYDGYIEKFLEEETFKENICTSLKNMIYFDKILENQEEKSYTILREHFIKDIKKIDNKENFLISINHDFSELYDNKGNLILDRFYLSNDDIIVINNNLILTILSEGLIDLIFFKPKTKIDKEDIKIKSINFGKLELRRRGRGREREGIIRKIRNNSEQDYIINYKNILSYDNNIIFKAEWLNVEKILVVLTKNYLAFYYINNINNFDIIEEKEFNNKNEFNINLHDKGYLYYNALNMVYNSYNSTLIILYLENEEDTHKTIFHFYIFDINSLSIIKQFDIKSKYYGNYYINILNEFTLIILFNSGMLYNISLKNFQIEEIIEVFDEIDNTDYFSQLNINTFNFKNDKKLVIFNHYKIKLFGFYPPHEIIEENLNDDKYKYLDLDMFNKKNYCLNYIETLNDSGKYVIGYSQFYQFFLHKYFFKTHIKIVGK